MQGAKFDNGDMFVDGNKAASVVRYELVSVTEKLMDEYVQFYNVLPQLDINFFIYCRPDRQDLHSFPTRRSSDLDWLTTRPVDVGRTTEQGLLGLLTTGSESNGSLMRVSPLGIWAAGDPALAARTARDDSTLTHPNEVCVEACAGFAAAIAAGIAG